MQDAEERILIQPVSLWGQSLTLKRRVGYGDDEEVRRKMTRLQLEDNMYSNIE